MTLVQTTTKYCVAYVDSIWRGGGNNIKYFSHSHWKYSSFFAVFWIFAPISWGAPNSWTGSTKVLRGGIDDYVSTSDHPYPWGLRFWWPMRKNEYQFRNSTHLRNHLPGKVMKLGQNSKFLLLRLFFELHPMKSWILNLKFQIFTNFWTNFVLIG